MVLVLLAPFTKLPNFLLRLNASSRKNRYLERLMSPLFNKYSFNTEGERERERERDREREGQRERGTERERDRERQRVRTLSHILLRLIRTP